MSYNSLTCVWLSGSVSFIFSIQISVRRQHTCPRQRLQTIDAEYLQIYWSLSDLIDLICSDLIWHSNDLIWNPATNSIQMFLFIFKSILRMAQIHHIILMEIIINNINFSFNCVCKSNFEGKWPSVSGLLIDTVAWYFFTLHEIFYEHF